MTSPLHLDFDTETPQGRFFLQVMGAVAEFERELIRERINGKLKVLKAQGQTIRQTQRQQRQEAKKEGWVLYAISEKLSFIQFSPFSFLFFLEFIEFF